MNKRNQLFLKVSAVLIGIIAFTNFAYAAPSVDSFDVTVGGVIRQIADGTIKTYRYVSGSVYRTSGACPDSLSVGPLVDGQRVISIFAQKNDGDGGCETDRSQSGFVTVDNDFNVVGEPRGPGGDDIPAPPDDPPADDPADPANDEEEDPLRREEELICDSEADGGNQNGAIDSPEEEACLQEAFENADTIPAALKCRDDAGEIVEGQIQISVGIGGGSKCIPAGDGTIEQNPIITLLKTALRVMSLGVGVVVAGMIVVAGIQYTASQGNPQATAEAKKRLMNAIIGLVMFIFSVAILNFLVPGGIIGG